MATSDIFGKFLVSFLTVFLGAIPKLHGSRAVSSNKMQFNLQNHDIERSAPRNLHIGLNKVENALRVDDIKGAKPQCVKFTTVRGEQNPLNPTYNLQSVSYLQPEATKFIRDQQHIDDIPGTRAVKKKNIEYQTRDVMKIDDIQGTKARVRHHGRPNGDN